mgnify:CR=1 FL=1
MTEIVEILRATILLLVQAYMIIMLLQAIMSWMPIDEENTLYRFVTTITEPLVAPIRQLLSRIPALARIPFDLSFIVAYFLIYLIYIILTAVWL